MFILDTEKLIQKLSRYNPSAASQEEMPADMNNTAGKGTAYLEKRLPLLWEWRFPVQKSMPPCSVL